MTDNTDTYLNLDSNQFNTWLKEFEVKYQEVENKTNIKFYYTPPPCFISWTS